MKHFMMSAMLACGVATVGTAATAQSISDQVISALREQGYSRIEVVNGSDQVKVEAIRGDRELEVVYDARTGEILKEEVSTLTDGRTYAPGIEISNERRNFVATRNNDDDDPGLGGNGRRFSDDDGDDDGDDDQRGRGQAGRDRSAEVSGNDDRGRGNVRSRAGGDNRRDRDDNRRGRDDDRDDDDGDDD
ncbi:PepSY domain-containing protein [Loktanella sp. SALINAS62]|uniref:PepSY domain-containing protein n=1 Tax=Loktanella sp. SALINAS62 TaxID=2706124 RepID=UPI001B8D453C|nr:PepSY domain-containing protein [Loktanella sp. SALINAS62]MBS1303195.1 PepSY domain-containing protein [Loktanella sp. SALINAS62]